MSVTAVVPLKALAAAKGRLAPALDGEQRRELVAWMAGIVIGACQACAAVHDVVVVAGDEEAAEVATAGGARALLVPTPGLAPALAAADDELLDRDSTLVVAADLPFVTAADLDAVIAAAASRPRAVVIAPTEDGGTGALLRRPPAVMGTAYGPGSATAHVALAAAAGIDALVVHRPGLSVDVDRPEQLPPTLAWRRRQAVGSADPSHPNPSHRTEESACRKAP